MDQKTSDRHDEMEAKNAEMARQQKLADQVSEEIRVDDDEDLDKRDKEIADSFPASDPPAP